MSDFSLATFYEELKRRRVIRVATLYVVAIWPIIQLLDIVSPTLNLPESVLNYLVIAFFAGLPFALLLAWIFDVDRDGIRLDDGEQHEPLLGSKVDLTIVGVLCVLVVALFFVQLAMEEDVPTSADVAQPPAAVPEVSVLAPEASIAVKPFDSFSADPSDQFFADGLSEELLNVLARIPELHVAARTSSFAYKGVNKNIGEIGRELNVATILEGSVRTNDVNNTIRVTAQLIDVASGAHIWSETYTHQYNDVFRIQDEISAAVAERLKLTLVGSTSTTTGDAVRTSSPDALIAYGQGQQELAKRTESSLKQAEALFQSAIGFDPNFALAYAGLADAASLQASYEFGDQTLHMKTAEMAVEKALSLDPELGIAWASKGLLLSQSKETRAEARRHLEQAMRLNPSYAMAVMWYASLEDDETKKLALYERAVALDPKSPVAAWNLATMYSAQGRDAEVMQLFGQMVEADPNYSRAYELVGQVSVRSGQLGDAIRYYQQAYELETSGDLAANIGKMYADIGEYEDSDVWFERALATVPEKYRSRVLWLRLGRYLAAGDNAAAREILLQIRQPRLGDLEDDFNRILANYYLDERAEMISDYEAAIASNRIITEDDGYASDFRVRLNIAVADQMMAVGQTERAEALLQTTELSLKKKLEKGSHYWPDDRYHLSRIASIRGQEQLALILLQRAVDEGWREHWRPLNDPAMQKVQADRFFLTMMAGLENRLTIIRDQLQLEAEFAMGS